MVNPPNFDLKSEEARIKSVYAQRQGSGRYSWFNHGYIFRIQGLERDLLASLHRHNFSGRHDKKVLEIGCGSGQWLREFVKWGVCPGNLTGIDILEDRVSQARRLYPREVQIHSGNAVKLPFESGQFDLVVQFTVFSSILDLAIKEVLAQEMLRVMRKDGMILWYDFLSTIHQTLMLRVSESKRLFSCFQAAMSTCVRSRSHHH